MKGIAVALKVLFAAVLLWASLPSSLTARSVTLAWIANTGTNLVGYRLYYGAATQNYSNSVSVPISSTNTTIDNLLSGQTYYFSVTAYTSDGLESAYSRELSYLCPGVTNTPPTLTQPSNRSINEDAGTQNITITGINSGSVPEIQTLSVTATSSNPGLIPQPTMNYASPDSAGILSFTPVANANGSAIITVTVNDGQLLNNLISRTFTVTVNPVNDAPTLNAPGNLSLAANPPAQTVNLTGIGTGAANESQPLSVTATSSNPSLVPHPTVNYTSPNATGTLTLTPAAGASGTATVTVTVNDGQAQNNLVTRTFTVSVAAGNQAPTLTAITDRTINEDAGAQTVNLSGIGSGSAGENQTLTVTAVSSNPGLIPNPAVTYASPNSGGSLSFTPTADISGSAIVTVTVNDGQALNNTFRRTFTVTVNPVNDAPTLNAPGNLSLAANPPAQTVNLTGIGTGSANEVQTLTVTATSSNPSLIPNPSVSYSSPGATGTLTLTPAAGAGGTATVTVTVNDGQAQNNLVTRTFTVSVAAGNQAPTLAAIADRTISEDAGTQTINLTGIGSGSASESQTLTLTAVSSNPGLIPNPAVTYASPNSGGSLSFTPTADISGSAIVTVTVNDGQALNNTFSRTFTVTVNPVNDAPTLNAPGNLSLAANPPAQTVNLSGIGTGSPNEVQTLTVTATSSNPSLIPNPSVSYTSPGATGALTLTPVAGASGTATVTVTVNDGQAQNNLVTRTFTVSVAAGNQAPTLAAIADRTINEDAGTQTVNLSGIGSGSASESQSLTVTAVSSNPGLVPNPIVTYTSPSATASLGFAQVADANGSAVITVTVNDGQALNNIFSRTFTVTVTPVNDAPTLNSLTDVSVSEDATVQTVNLSGIGAGASNESQSLAVTASSSNPTLVANPTVSYTSPNTTGTLSFTPMPNAFGTAVITVTVNDGQASANTVSRTFTVTVGGLNDTPTLGAIGSMTINEDAGVKTVSVTGIGAGINEAQTLSVTATSSNPSLIPTPSVSYVSPSTIATLNFAPVANAYGTATITVTVDDGQSVNNTFSQTFTVTVNPVNDTPTLGAIANLSLPAGASAQSVNLAGIGTGAANESQTLTVTATSGNPSLIPNPTVGYTSPSATGTLNFTPVAGAGGTATITVTVNDGQAQNNIFSQTFTVSVAVANQPPTLAAIADQTIAEDAGSQTMNIGGIGSGSVTENQVLTVTVVSSDPGILPNPTVVYTSPNSTAALNLAPQPDAFGSAVITVTVNDGQVQNSTVSRTFTVMVSPMNDAPTLAALNNLSVGEDAGAQSVSLSGIGSGAANESQSLAVSAVSSNPSVVPNPSVTYASPNTTGTLSLTPAANASGTAIITVTVNDGQAQNNLVTQTFTVTVGALNDPPNLTALSNVSVNEDSGVQTVNLSGISGGLGENQAVTVTAASSNPALIPNPAIVFTNPNSTGLLNFTPAFNANGTATITVTVDDGQSQNNTFTRSFAVTINPVNDAPNLNPLANMALTLNAPAQTISLSGINSGATNETQTLSISATSSNPSLIPTPSVSYASPNTTGTLSFTPVTSASGSATITVTVNDGQAQNNLSSRTFTITVANGNQPPTINSLSDLVVTEDSPQQLVNFSGLSAGAGESQSLAVTASSSDPSLIPTPIVHYGSPSSGGYITFIPTPNAFGTAWLTVTVNDGQSVNNTASRIFRVTVAPVNDVPTLNPIADVDFYEDTGSRIVNLTGISSGATNENQTLVLTVTSSNPSIIPPPDIDYVSPALTGRLIVNPVTNAVGTSIITVTLNDGDSTRNVVVRSFIVGVRGLNDLPVISAIADQTLRSDESIGPIPFTVADPDTSMVDVRLSVSSSDTVLLPVSRLVLGGSGNNRSITISPATGGIGTALVTVAATDGWGTNTESFTVTVGPTNQTPVISPIADQAMDASTTLTNVSFVVGDQETPAGNLSTTAHSFNQLVVPDSGLVLLGSGATRRLVITPARGKSGQVAIAITVSDGQRQVQTSFQLTVRSLRSRLTVNKKGQGTVEPDLNGQNLVVGESFTVTATPEAGQVFECWGGDVAGSTTTLTFVMAENMVIEANFQQDSYVVAQGTYNGLITESDEVRHEQSGALSFVSTSRGSYSGKLQVGRGKHTVKGLLARDGRATNVVLRPGQSSLTVEVALSIGTTPGRLTGRITDGSWEAQLLGDRQGYNAKTNPAPFAGTFTLAMPADTTSPENPPGAGYGTVKIDANGVATFLGMLADGTKVTQKVPLSADAHWPFYASLYKAGGSALGWLTLDRTEGEFSGLMSWIKPSMVSRYYAAGLTNESQIIGCTYVAPSAVQMSGNGNGNGARQTDIAFSGANLSDVVTDRLMVLPNGKMVVTGSGAVKFGMSPTTGLFKGTVTDPGTRKPRAYTGVVLQKWNIGAGLVLGLDEVGLVELAQP